MIVGRTFGVDDVRGSFIRHSDIGRQDDLQDMIDEEVK